MDGKLGKSSVNGSGVMRVECVPPGDIRALVIAVMDNNLGKKV